MGIRPSKPAPNGSSSLPFFFLTFWRALDRRVLGASRARLRAVEEHVAQLLRESPERHREVDAKDAAERAERFLDELAVAFRPRRDRPRLERQRVVWYNASGVEVVHRSQPLALLTRAVRRVERERARRHLRHAHAAPRAGEPAREQPIAAVERVDDDDVVGKAERDLDRLGEPPLDPGLENQPIDDDVDGVIAAAIELDVLVERSLLIVDADLREAAGAQRRQLLLELAFPAADDRREHVHALLVRRQHHHVDDAFEGLRRDLAAAQVAMGHADVGEEQPQVVVDLGDRADRRTRVRPGRLLLDRDGRRQAVDQVDVRLLHLLEELAGVGGQRFDIAPLALGVNRVEGERGLPRPRQAGNDDQPVTREVDVDILEVVDARAAHRNPVVRHREDGYSGRFRSSPKTAILARGSVEAETVGTTTFPGFLAAKASHRRGRSASSAGERLLQREVTVLRKVAAGGCAGSRRTRKSGCR